MQLRITKSRAAVAALFTLAGVGLGSLLTPLVGSALATAGQLVNVADRTADYTARVDATGALKTEGTTAPTLPRRPFHLTKTVFNNQNPAWLTAPTTATLALTDISVNNPPGNTVGTLLSLYQVASSSSSICTATTPQRFLMYRSVPPGTTADLDLSTPIALKPLSPGQPYCLRGSSVTSFEGTSNRSLGITLTGYVPAGTFG